jgi:AAA family ATP:ADP antiporter
MPAANVSNQATPTSRRPRLASDPAEYLLGLVADVRPGEAPTALLLTLNVFLLLTAYYLLKVAREPLILVQGGAEVKSYAAVGQSLLLVPVTAVYGWLAARVRRMALIAWVTAFFCLNLVGFAAVGLEGVPVGVAFFLWVGIFNVTIVAQFWSFAADLYTEDQGKRLFAIIGVGSSVGAVAGASIADGLSRLGLGPFGLMQVAAGVLLVCLGITYAVHRRESDGDAVAKRPPPPVLHGGNGFALVFRDHYLLLFAGLVFVLNVITKTGDYVLDRKLLEAAHEASHSSGVTVGGFIGTFKARYFEWINVLGVVLQVLVVSRAIKYLGLRGALAIMPAASLLGYGAALVSPVLSVLFVARVVESSLDYSLSNTTRQALWLVTSRDDKYKAKQVIDTFIVRAGDAVSAGVVWFGSHAKLPPQGFLAINVALSLTWLVIAWQLGRNYTSRIPQAEAAGGVLSLDAA